MANIIKIKGKPIGIFGLELALNKVRTLMKEEGLDAKEGARKLLEIIQRKNYIPSSVRSDYLEALELLLKEESDVKGQQERGPLTVRILGPGCIGCNRIEELVLQIMSEKAIAADIYHVTDRDEIHRYGVEKTPALMIGDKLVSSGKIPSKAEIELWLTQS